MKIDKITPQAKPKTPPTAIPKGPPIAPIATPKPTKLLETIVVIVLLAAMLIILFLSFSQAAFYIRMLLGFVLITYLYFK